MEKKKGFTLVELLATIMILAIVVGITVFIAITVIRRAKTNTYEVTINEVEKDANSYIIENTDRLSFVTDENNDDIEYQCVTVQNLIDYGYLNKNVIGSEISETDKVMAKDYIYLERDANSKAITKSVYVGHINPEYAEKCGDVVSGYGSIDASSVPGFDEWSRTKKITITYSLSNVNDYNELDNYKYRCIYENDIYDGTDDGTHKVFEIKKNGTLYCTIRLDDKVIDSYTRKITNIDNIRPVITLGSYTKGKTSTPTVIPIVVTDIGSGVDTSSFTEEDIVLTIGGEKTSNFTLEDKGKGNYELKINDKTHIGKVEITIDEDKVLDNVGNGNITTVLKPDINIVFAYIVTYDSNGGNACDPNNKKVLYSAQYGNLCKPTRTGYTFSGWFTDKTGGTEIKNTTKVEITSDQTIYAHWKPNQYVITYDSNGGSVCNPATKTVTYDGTYGKLCKPTRHGYTFTGWFTDKNNGSEIKDSSKVTIVNNQTVYAHWALDEFTVTYNSNGGSACNPATKKVKFGLTYGDLCKPTRTGYEFVDWFTAPNGGTVVRNTTNVSLTNNQTIYAHWIVKTTGVTFYRNISSSDTASVSQQFTYGVNGNRFGYNTSGNAVWGTAGQFGSWNKTGFTLLGWNEDRYAASANYSPYSGVSNDWIASKYPNVALYGIWRPNNYTVTFDSKGGSDCGNKIVTYGSTYGDLCTPTRLLYVFKGWYTASFSGSRITSGTTVSITSNQTLYAHWDMVEISCDTGGGGGGGGGCSCSCGNTGCCNCGDSSNTSWAM